LELSKRVIPITSASISDSDMDELEDCDSGSCPIK